MCERVVRELLCGSKLRARELCVCVCERRELCVRELCVCVCVSKVCVRELLCVRELCVCVSKLCVRISMYV